MNREDIIRMAHEAGFEGFGNGDWVCTTEEIERFAALVAAAERQAVLDTVDALMGMERDRNPMFSEGYDYALEDIEQFVKGRK